MAYITNSTSPVLKDLIEKSQRKRTTAQCSSPALYRLPTYRETLSLKPFIERCTYGERNKKKNNTILLVGETGTGKTTLINTIVNHTLGVQFKDQLWFEITDGDEKGKDQTKSQTTRVTVYEVFMPDRPTLTIIDTPGYGDTRGLDNDTLIAEQLLQLFRSENGIHEITAVALVVNNSQNRISDRQAYIFDSVLSLFAKDIAENIMLFVTHAGNNRISKNLLAAIKKANIPCAKNESGQPMHFLFDNCQSEEFADLEEYESSEREWKIGAESWQKLMKTLDNMRGQSLRMTEGVLKDRKQLEASINCIREQIELIESNQNELHQTEEALKVNRQNMEKGRNFSYEVDETVKEKVPTGEPATCCDVCKENCHLKGCWWVKDLSWCSVMKNNFCTVCTNHCHYTEHKKEKKMYTLSTKKVTKTYEDLKAMFTSASEKFVDNLVIQTKLKTKLEELEGGKDKLVDKSYQCIIQLESIALKSSCLSLSLENLDFLIEKMKETGILDRVRKLEAVKTKREEETKERRGGNQREAN